MRKIGTFEIVDHGIEHSQYFQGCGTAFTSYDHVQTGIGANFAEAYADATDMIAQIEEGEIDWTEFDKRVLAEIGRKTLPKRPQVSGKHSEEHYYHVSIRYCMAETWEVIVGNVGTVYSGDDKDVAETHYKEYKRQSEDGIGRAGSEPVTIMCDGEIVREFHPPEVFDGQS